MPLVSARRSVMQCKERKAERRRRRRTRDMATYFLRNPILSFQSLLLPAEAFLSFASMNKCQHTCVFLTDSLQRGTGSFDNIESIIKNLLHDDRGESFSDFMLLTALLREVFIK